MLENSKIFVLKDA